MMTASAASLRSATALDPARLWLAGFPIASLAFFMTRPDAATALAVLVALSLALCTLAISAVSAESGEWRKGHDLIASIAPFQFAAALWLSVSLAGTFGMLAAIPVSVLLLSAILCAEAIVSAGLLLAVRRGHGGEPVAMLVSAKYAGVLGRLI